MDAESAPNSQPSDEVPAQENPVTENSAEEMVTESAGDEGENKNVSDCECIAFMYIK